MGLKRGGAEREFETHLLKFETYLVLRDYETEKTTGAPAPASLAPMYMCIVVDICTSNALMIMHLFENEGSQDKSTKYVNNMTHQ